MADKIANCGRAGLDISPARSRHAARSDTVAATGGQQRPEAGRDSVRLSGQADLLREVEAGLKALPDVDRKRVARLRQQLRSGDYEVDAERLARKLLRLERELG